MDYSKFNKEAFEYLGNDTKAIEELTASLQDEVLKELHQEILKSFEKVISKVNEQGHNLVPYTEKGIGDYSYRDTDANGNCGLRLGCDVIISSGIMIQ